MHFLSSSLIILTCFYSLASYSEVKNSELKELLKRFEYQKETTLKSFKKITMFDIKSLDSIMPGKKANVQMKKFKVKQLLRTRFWQRKYEVYDGVLESINPVDGSFYDNKFYYFKSKKRGPNPLIVLFPVISGITPVEKYLASYYASKGYNVLIARLSEDITDVRRPIEDIDGFLVRSVISARVLLDMALEFDEVDANRVGFIGSSMGGIRLLLLMGVDPRVQYAVTYVAGGNIPDIMTHSIVSEISHYKRVKMKELFLDSNYEYKQLLKKSIEIDPVRFVSRINRDNLKMIISKKDKGVPTRNQLEIWGRLGKPEVSFIGSGHAVSVITSFLRRAKNLEFFQSKWKR